MTQEYKITLPKLGESIVSATVVQWFKKEGDKVQLDEPLLEVSTDKVNSEIPSPVAGILKKVVARVDEEIQVGEVLAVIEMQEGGGSEKIVEKPASQSENVSNEGNKDFLSPGVLKAASDAGISVEELKKIKGTGAGGRISRQDIEEFVQFRTKSCHGTPSSCAPSSSPSSQDVERLKLTGMRKAIADNMVKSFYEAPHATLINEVDVTEIIRYIHKNKEDFFARYGAKLTVTSFVIQAVAKALGEFPLLNSSLDKDTIVVKKYVNVGVAVSVDQGLIVPVVKNCQKNPLCEIAKSVQDLSQKARNGKLQPEDVVDGTISVTNFGMSGVSIGVPIIRYPEVAIIGIGAIKKRVQVLEDDSMAIRSMLYVSLTFDHRVIDGMYGCGFLASVQKYLEESIK